METDRRQHNKDIAEVLKTIDDHAHVDLDFQNESLKRDEEGNKKLDRILRILLGDEEAGELGVVKKLERLDPILDAWKSVKWIFGFILGIFGLALLVKNLFLK